MATQTIQQLEVVFNRRKTMRKTELFAQHQQMNPIQGAELSKPPRQETDAIAQSKHDFKLLHLQRNFKQLQAKIYHTLKKIESLQANPYNLCSSTTDVIVQIQDDLKQLYIESSLSLRGIESLQANHSTMCAHTNQHYIKQKMRQQQFWICRLNHSVSLFVSRLRSDASGIQAAKCLESEDRFTLITLELKSASGLQRKSLLGTLLGSLR